MALSEKHDLVTRPFPTAHPELSRGADRTRSGSRPSGTRGPSSPFFIWHVLVTVITQGPSHVHVHALALVLALNINVNTFLHVS